MLVKLMKKIADSNLKIKTCKKKKDKKRTPIVLVATDCANM